MGGYISNMYFKMIANKPMYWMGKGGDLSFTSGDVALPNYNIALGDINGQPQAYTGWRTSCMYLWNTTMGGPCVLRPTNFVSWDSPYKGTWANPSCLKGVRVEADGTCPLPQSPSWLARLCKGFYCNEQGVFKGGKSRVKPLKESKGPWSSDQSEKEKQNRHNNGWSNQFAFPWEVGMMYDFQVGGEMQRPMGCKGLDEPFGSLSKPLWPQRNSGSPIWSSPAMECKLNGYAPEGKPMHKIIEDLASDNEFFALKFLEAYGMMASNGYVDSDLEDGPQNGWFGHYSLSQQGIDIGDFVSYIETNSPVTFTDRKADPWICGHRGHVVTTCGTRFSKYLQVADGRYSAGRSCELKENGC